MISDVGASSDKTDGSASGILSIHIQTPWPSIKSPAAWENSPLCRLKMCHMCTAGWLTQVPLDFVATITHTCSCADPLPHSSQNLEQHSADQVVSTWLGHSGCTDRCASPRHAEATSNRVKERANAVAQIACSSHVRSVREKSKRNQHCFDRFQWQPHLSACKLVQLTL